MEVLQVLQVHHYPMLLCCCCYLDQYARFKFILLTPACTRPHTKSANDSFGSGLEVELVRRLRRVRAQPAIWSFSSHIQSTSGSQYKRPCKCLLV